MAPENRNAHRGCRHPYRIVFHDLPCLVEQLHLLPRIPVTQNLSAVLKAAGKGFDDVVRVGVFLTSMSDYAPLNGIYAKHFRQPFPARTTIAAAALPLGARVEIDLVVKA